MITPTSSVPKSSVTRVCHCSARDLQQVSASFILVYILKHSIIKTLETESQAEEQEGEGVKKEESEQLHQIRQI